MEAACVDNAKQKTSLWSIDSGFFFPLREEKNDTDEDQASLNDEL